MSTKSALLLCAHAIFIQAIAGACLGNVFNSAWPAGGCGEVLGRGGPGVAIEAPLIEAALIEAAPCVSGAPFIGLGRAGYRAGGVVPSNGGGLTVSSASPIAPIGVSAASENAIEGILAVGGELPFLSTVGLEGALPTVGAGAVAYGCGNGDVGIVAEDVAPIAAGLPLPAAGLGYGASWAGAGGLGWGGRGMGLFGCGCGAL